MKTAGKKERKREKEMKSISKDRREEERDEERKKKKSFYVGVLSRWDSFMVLLFLLKVLLPLSYWQVC